MVAVVKARSVVTPGHALSESRSTGKAIASEVAVLESFTLIDTSLHSLFVLGLVTWKQKA